MYAIRKTDDAWVGVGRLINEQTSHPMNVRVIVRLTPSTEQNTRTAVLSDGTYRMDFKDEEILEAERYPFDR